MKSNLIKEYLLPTCIIAKSNNIINSNALFENRENQVFLGEDNLLSCDGKGYIILDFGKELRGGIRILSHRLGCNSNGKIRIRFGESVSESCAEIGEKNAGNYHSIRDITLSLPMLCDQEFGDTGFRFARIDFLDDVNYNLINVYASSYCKNIEFRGSFECDDKDLNKIFETAKYTLYLTMQDYLWEGVKRDRLVWVGDMQQQVLAITYLFGNVDIVEKSIKESVLKNPLPRWFGNIPTYSLTLIQILYDYYLKNKNSEFVFEILPYVEGVLEQLDLCVDENGNIDYSKSKADARNGYYLDWPTSNSQDAKLGNNYLYIYILKNLIKLYEYLGINVNPLCNTLIKKLSKANGEVNYKQIVSLGYLAGKISKEETAQKLSLGGARGLSTFMGYYICKVMKDTLGLSKTLDIIKEYYGGMISRGATTFWEDFDIDWLENSGRIDELTPLDKKDLHGDFGQFCYKGFRHSLCHGWSCGPIQFLFEDVLGVNVIEPGCSVIEIKPNLANLKYCKGTFPTPYGDVYIEHKMIDGKIQTQINAPTQIKIIK